MDAIQIFELPADGVAIQAIGSSFTCSQCKTEFNHQFLFNLLLEGKGEVPRQAACTCVACGVRFGKIESAL